jgi:hypothetical protein
VSEIPRTATVMDDQVSLALARVHGRLRRRRNRLRGAGAAALACVALLGVGFATRPQGPEADARFGIDAVEPGGPQTGAVAPEQSGTCGHALAPAGVFGLELAIQEPVEWPVREAPFGALQQVVVEARNAGTRSLTISIPAGVVGLSDDAFVDTEEAAPALMPSTVTLEPSEVVELPAALPSRSCSGDILDGGTYTVVPVVAVEDAGPSPVAVRGSALTVQHR